MTDVLMHGSLDAIETTAPRLGKSLEVPRIGMNLAPGHPYEVHFQAPQDVVCIMLGHVRGKRAYDTDKMSKLDVVPGNLIFHPKGSVTHVEGTEVRGEFVAIDMPESLRQRLLDELGSSSSISDLSARDDMKSHLAIPLAQSIRKAILSGSSNQVLLTETLATIAMSKVINWHLGKPHQGASQTSLSTATLNDITDFIEAHLHDNLSLAQIAEVAGISPYHMARCFKDTLQMSPHQYVLERRVARARELLEADNSTLADIAYTVGGVLKPSPHDRRLPQTPRHHPRRLPQGDGVMTAHTRHGTENHVAVGSPALDRHWDFDTVRLHLVRPKPFEVNFVSDADTLSLPLGRLETVTAYDSDVQKPDGSRLGHINFHPAGSQTFCRTTTHMCELVAVDVDPLHRDSFAEKGRLLEGSDSRVRLETPGVASLTQLIRRRLLSDEPLDTLTAEALAMLVLDATISAVQHGPSDQPRAKSLSPSDLARLLDFIECQLAEDISLTCLASEAGLSVYHFSRSFKASLGLSPHQYVLERRIARARELLEAGTCPLADIAYTVGFSSQAHMTDVFRKRLGITPGAYRKEVSS